MANEQIGHGSAINRGVCPCFLSSRLIREEEVVIQALKGTAFSDRGLKALLVVGQ
jgi:hypothetical protein